MWVAEFMKHIEINITWDFNDLVTLLYRDAEQRTEDVVATISRHILEQPGDRDAVINRGGTDRPKITQN